MSAYIKKIFTNRTALVRAGGVLTALLVVFFCAHALAKNPAQNPAQNPPHKTYATQTGLTFDYPASLTAYTPTEVYFSECAECPALMNVSATETAYADVAEALQASEYRDAKITGNVPVAGQPALVSEINGERTVFFVEKNLLYRVTARNMDATDTQAFFNSLRFEK
jgi:hypothetical protein